MHENIISANEMTVRNNNKDNEKKNIQKNYCKTQQEIHNESMRERLDRVRIERASEGE